MYDIIFTYIYIYTVRCLGSPGQKCVSKDNNMKNVVFTVAKRGFWHAALESKTCTCADQFFFVREVASRVMS